MQRESGSLGTASTATSSDIKLAVPFLCALAEELSVGAGEGLQVATELEPVGFNQAAQLMTN